MNKCLVIFLLCISSFLQIQGQNFGGGWIAGASTTQVAGDALGGYNKIGLLVGGFTNLRWTKNLQMQMEFTFIQKGSQNPSLQKNNIAEISLNYMEIPLGITWQQQENIGIEFGVLSAFLLSSTMNDYYGELEISPEFEKTDFGLFVGIDYSLNRKMILSTRASNSFIPIRPHSSGATYGWNKGQYNTVLSFAIYYHIK